MQQLLMAAIPTNPHTPLHTPFTHTPHHHHRRPVAVPTHSCSRAPIMARISMLTPVIPSNRPFTLPPDTNTHPPTNHHHHHM